MKVITEMKIKHWTKDEMGVGVQSIGSELKFSFWFHSSVGKSVCLKFIGCGFKVHLLNITFLSFFQYNIIWYNNSFIYSRIKSAL